MPDSISPQTYYKQFSLAPLSKEDAQQLQSQKQTLLSEGAFSGELTFGTGGVREIVGLGSKRINLYTIARLVKATSNIIKKQISSNLKIIIGYDSRLSNTYLPILAYKILKENGFNVHLYNEVVPTPIISFAVHNLAYDIGMMFTASHNSSEYNGFKMYDSDGSQIISPLDQEIQEEYRHTAYQDIPSTLQDLSDFEQVSSSDILSLDTTLPKFYKKLNSENFINNSSKKISILYSPLHGSGAKSFSYLFSKFQFHNFSILKEQEKPDGTFPTISLPNPEEPQVFSLLKKQALKTKQTLLLATDADTDRLGAMVYDSAEKEYYFLTGNQIGVLLLDYLGKTKSKKVNTPLAYKTIVTSGLFSKVAHTHNIKVKETLTGFKYIANQIKENPEQFIFGAEESFGYLPVSWIRDKDALSTALLLANYAEQICLIEKLKQLYYQHGYYIEDLFSINFSSKNLQVIKKINAQLKQPQELIKFLSNEKRTYSIIDSLVLMDAEQQPKTKYLQNLKKELPKSNVLLFYLKPEGQITIRTSGTEPKVKFYINLCSIEMPNKKNLKKVQKNTQNELQFFKKQLLVFFNSY